MAWEQWIAPQLAKAPFAISSAFDMLWWLNFTCKWQQVGMRCCHDGGKPLAPVFELRGDDMVPAEEGGAREERTVEGLLGSIRHFFDDPRLELWASVPECHVRKVWVCPYVRVPVPVRARVHMCVPALACIFCVACVCACLPPCCPSDSVTCASLPTSAGGRRTKNL